MYNGYSQRNSFKEDRERKEDLEFLAKLKASNHEELQQVLKNHWHKNVAKWKVVAIHRALKRTM